MVAMAWSEEMAWAIYRRANGTVVNSTWHLGSSLPLLQLCQYGFYFFPEHTQFAVLSVAALLRHRLPIFSQSVPAHEAIAIDPTAP